MAGTYKIPYQNLSFAIPDIGEVFRDKGGAPTIFKRTETGIQTLGVETLGREYLAGIGAVEARNVDAQGRLISNAPTYVYKFPDGHKEEISKGFFGKYGKIALSEQGIDYEKTPTGNFNYADLQTAFGASVSSQDVSAFALPKPETIKTGEIITKSISPINPQGADVTSSFTGEISKAPSTREALESAAAGQGDTISPAQYEALMKLIETGQVAPDIVVKELQKQIDTGNYSGDVDVKQLSGGKYVRYETLASGDIVGYLPDGNWEYVGNQSDFKPDIVPTSDQQNQIKESNTDENVDLDKLLAGSGLSDDEQGMIRAIFDASSSKSEEDFDRLLGAMEAAKKISDPFFSNQIRLATDALKRGFEEIEGDLEFQETQKLKQLEDLREDVRTGTEFLDISQKQELKNLDRKLTQDLENISQQMAETGFVRSTRRTEKETLEKEVSGELRESSKRKFGLKRGELTSTLSRNERDIQAEVDRLKELAGEKKRTLSRTAEELVGTEKLPSLPGLEPLGGIPGSIARQRQQDIFGFSSSFVF